MLSIEIGYYEFNIASILPPKGTIIAVFLALHYVSFLMEEAIPQCSFTSISFIKVWDVSHSGMALGISATLR